MASDGLNWRQQRCYNGPFEQYDDGRVHQVNHIQPAGSDWSSSGRYYDSGFPQSGFNGMTPYNNGYGHVPLSNPGYQNYGYGAPGSTQYMMPEHGTYMRPMQAANHGVGVVPDGNYMWPSPPYQPQPGYGTPYPNLYSSSPHHVSPQTKYHAAPSGGVYGSEHLKGRTSGAMIKGRNGQKEQGIIEYFSSFRPFKNVTWMNDFTPDDEWPGGHKLKVGEPFFAIIRHWLTPLRAVVLSVDKMAECCMVTDNAPPEISTPTMRAHFKPERLVQVQLKWPQEYDDKGRPVVELYLQNEGRMSAYREDNLVWSIPLMIYRNQAIMRLDKSDDVALLYFCELCTNILDNKLYNFTDFIEKGDRIQLQLTRQPYIPYHFTYRAAIPWNSARRLEWANRFPMIKEVIAPCEYNKAFVKRAYDFHYKNTYGIEDNHQQQVFERPENDADEQLYSILPTPNSPVTISEFTRRIGGKLKDVLRFLLLKAQSPIDPNAQLTVNLAKSIYNFVAGRTEFNDIDDHMNERELELLKGKSEVVCLQRPPVVVLMGHINHGKTALFDMLTDTKNIEDEPGNITQSVRTFTTAGKCPMTLIDTPGHEVFDAMRRCGAAIADIAIIAIDAIEGLKEQSNECIRLCKSLNIPFIIAATKCDLPGANQRTEELALNLSDEGVIIESLGGDTQFLQVSAKQDIDNSKEAIMNAIILQSAATDDRVVAESPGIIGRGFVLESGKSQRSSPYCLAIIKQGSMSKGGLLVSGKAIAKIKTLKTPDGKRVTTAKPSQAVFVDGFEDDVLPIPGDPFVIYENENDARLLSEQQLQDDLNNKVALELQRKITESINVLNEESAEDQSVKYVTVVIKGGTQGALDAVKRSISALKVEGMSTIGFYEIVSGTVGPICKSDIIDAHESKAVILGLDSPLKSDAKAEAKRLGVAVMTSDVIYDLMDQATESLRKNLGERPLTELYGTARVLKVFDAIKNAKAAGCVVARGRIPKDSAIRVVRQGKPVFAGKLASLRHTTDSIEEAVESQSCGMIFEGWNGVKVDDIIEAYEP
ncbi:translation initiation factor IF-2 [Babesia ovis]|uniref:Translation initiation factor IF-2 n=1 Tax=Babesia ovis TaxID=5869 RepID=A0A9W5TAK2_BABOV|nr:translation initiation factor IF-2 [Babesia ovis]